MKCQLSLECLMMERTVLGLNLMKRKGEHLLDHQEVGESVSFSSCVQVM